MGGKDAFKRDGCDSCQTVVQGFRFGLTCPLIFLSSDDIDQVGNGHERCCKFTVQGFVHIDIEHPAVTNKVVSGDPREDVAVIEVCHWGVSSCVLWFSVSWHRIVKPHAMGPAFWV